MNRRRRRFALFNFRLFYTHQQSNNDNDDEELSPTFVAAKNVKQRKRKNNLLKTTTMTHNRELPYYNIRQPLAYNFGHKTCRATAASLYQTKHCCHLCGRRTTTWAFGSMGNWPSRSGGSVSSCCFEKWLIG